MIFHEVEGKPNLLKSECKAFTILRDDRFSPPLYRATKWSPDQIRTWANSDRPKVTLGRFDSLEDAQRACEAAV